MSKVEKLLEQINQNLKGNITNTVIALDELTITVPPKHLHDVCMALRDKPFAFDTLIDVCGVDYLHYGLSEWETANTTDTGFSRAVSPEKESVNPWEGKRFAAVYHLLSVANNHRIRIKVLLDEESLEVESVNDIWPAANWFEREAFDLFGIVFKGHPDLRRILTDYGFIGHPFRKDFPLIGEVEMHYDAEQGRCVYGPVSIQPRTLVPKVIREQNVKPQSLSTGGESNE